MRRRVGMLAVSALALAVWTLPGAPEAKVHGVEDEPTVRAGEDPNIPPTRRKAMLAWLQEKRYLEGYTAEPGVHPSSGPHGGNVRTFFNSLAFQARLLGYEPDTDITVLLADCEDSGNAGVSVAPTTSESTSTSSRRSSAHSPSPNTRSNALVPP